MRTRSLTSRFIKGLLELLAATICFLTPCLMRADQSILLRSGNGTGSQDTQVRFVRYAVGQDTPPTASDFAAAQTGAFAYINTPYYTYIKPAQFSDPLAQWIGTTSGLGAGSALYAIPFKVTDPIVAAANLTLGYAVDNAIHGVYINGVEISNFINDGDYHGEYYYMRSDIASLLTPNATNWLYIKTYDSGGYAGLLFTATINTQGTAPGAPTITPSQGGNTGKISFRIIGAGFEAGTSAAATLVEAGPVVTLTGTGTTITATNVVVSSPNVLTGTFDLTNVTPGTLTVTVTDRDGTAIILKNAFTVQSGGGPNIVLQTISTPAVLARIQFVFIAIANLGNSDGTAGVDAAIEPWSTYLVALPTPTTIEPLTFPIVPFNAILLWDNVNVPPGSIALLGYSALQSSTFPVDTNVVIELGCVASNIDSANATCSGKLEASLLADAISCSAFPLINTTCVKPVQKDYAAYEKCMIQAAAKCNPSSTNVRTSVDPNDLNGPVGYADPMWIQSPGQMNYALSFNNLSTATKAATNVSVTNTFDPTTVDLTTLSVGSVVIGSTNYTLSGTPLAAQPFTQDLDLRPTQNLVVRVTGSLNQSTNQVTVNFFSLDPATGIAPVDPTIGFLAPNAGGAVLFSVTPKTSLTTGTAIVANGSVVFDTNAAINTNIWSNSIDVTPPVSQVVALPATTANSGFTVSWAGTDVGSGIQNYSIYVSDNGAAYTQWQNATTSTSATYTGTAGHTYSFYSLALDNVGNTEAAKTSAETYVKVLGMSSTTLKSSASTASPGQSVTLTAAVADASGLGLTPSGAVTFFSGTTSLGTQGLNSSAVSGLSVSLPVGTDSITAQYSGDSNFAPSTSVATVVSVPSYSVALSPASLTVSGGQSGQTTVTLTPVGGFNSAVTFSCSGLPAFSTCTFVPASVTPGGTNTPVTTTLTVKTNVATAALLPHAMPGRRPGKETELLAFILLALPGLFRLRQRSGKRFNLPYLLLAGILTLGIISMGALGCGHGAYTITPPGTYAVSITAAGGGITQTTNLSLTAQ